ncbi:MAG: hypothetical protein WBQ69_02600 [Gallionella sp.]
MKIPAIPTRISLLRPSVNVPLGLSMLYRDSYNGDILPIHKKSNMADRKPATQLKQDRIVNEIHMKGEDHFNISTSDHPQAAFPQPTFSK